MKLTDLAKIHGPRIWRKKLEQIGSRLLTNSRATEDEALVEKMPVKADNYANHHSYSQEGEDLILRELFADKQRGFYVDIGAHHPFRFSNTQHFYEIEWRGINIDPTPGSKELFDKHRPDDINLELGIGRKEAELTFYIFDEQALNTFEPARVEHLLQSTPYKLVDKQLVSVVTLDSVLTSHAIGKSIDFMSIDVEKQELEVLGSNDWQKFRPKVLVIEILDLDLMDLTGCPEHNYIVSQNYRLWAKTFRTAFYMANEIEDQKMVRR